MNMNPSNFIYLLKQQVTGLNGDSTPTASNGLLPGVGTTVLSSSQSTDGGIKKDDIVPLPDIIDAAEFPVITDSTGGTASATFAAITAPAANATTSLTADMTAVKNALAQIALQLNAINRQVATSVSSVPAIAVAAGATVIGTFSFAVPRDYDEASDHLVVYLEANSTAADLNITVTGTVTVAPIASQAGAGGIVATTKTTVTATAPFSTAALNVTTLVQVFAINLSGYSLKRNDVVSIALAFAGTTSGIDYVYSVFRHYDSMITSYNETDSTDDPSNPTNISSVGQAYFGNPLR